MRLSKDYWFRKPYHSGLESRRANSVPLNPEGLCCQVAEVLNTVLLSICIFIDLMRISEILWNPMVTQHGETMT